MSGAPLWLDMIAVIENISMGPAAEDLTKRRELYFREPHPDPQQANSAMLLLQRVPGILHLEAPTVTTLRVEYDIRCITLKNIEEALGAVGLHLDNSVLNKVRRAIWHYAEETQRANMGCEQGSSNCTRRVFMNRYGQREHGCRDERPQHWRRYL